MERRKVICVVGPTACGKTTLGVLLAQKYNGEIVSADSMQIYRGMVIGTAAPRPEEMDGIPHHMVGVADPQETYSAARFVEDASACVESRLAGALPSGAAELSLWPRPISGRLASPAAAGPAALLWRDALSGA